MTNTEIHPQWATAADEITTVVDGLPQYNTYGTSQDVVDHFKHLSTLRFGGIKIDTEQIGEQVAPDGTAAPLVQSTLSLGENDGYTIYLKGGVHGNELAYRRTQVELSVLALQRPRLFRRLGIDRLIFFDADPVTGDMNSWNSQNKEHTLFNYLQGVRRSADQADWDYPIEHGNFTHISSIAGCIASQQIIHKEHLRLIVPIHNADIGSYFSYLAGEMPGQANDQSAFMHRLYKGFQPVSPEGPQLPPLADGVYRMPNWEETSQAIGSRSPWGELSVYYAQQVAEQNGWGPVTGAIVEPAYFRASALADKRMSGLTHQETMHRNIEQAARVLDDIERLLPQVSDNDFDDPWGLVKDISFYAIGLARRTEHLRSAQLEQPDRMLTVSDVADTTSNFNYYVTRPLGMLSNLARRLGSSHQSYLAERLGEEVEFLNAQLRPVAESPRKLVQAQVGTVLLSALAIARPS